MRQLALVSLMLFAASSLQAQIDFDPPSFEPAPAEPDSVALADFDGDGDIDMAATTDAPDKISLYFNLGDGSFSGPTQVNLGNGTGPAGLVATDVDGDGDLDLVTTLHNVNQIQVITNNGGVFTPGGQFAVGTNPRHIAAGRLDGGATVDVVVSNRDANTVTVLLGGGNGSFGSRIDYSVGQEPRGIDLGDFNGDGALDIVVGAHDSREVDVLLNLGNGTFGPPIPLSVGNQVRPEGVVAADFDRDGDDDIAAATSTNGASFATVFLNLGNATFGGAVHYPMNALEASGIVAADLDNDGRLDLATANSDSHNVTAISGNGMGSFGAPLPFPVGVTPERLAVADLDGNGSQDLVTANRDSNDLSVLFNRRSLKFNGTAVPGSPANFTISGLPPVENGRTALVLISCTGTAGFPLPGDGRIVPLTFDSCTQIGLSLSIALRGTVMLGTANTPVIPFPNAAPGTTVFAAAVTIGGGQFHSILGPISFVTQ